MNLTNEIGKYLNYCKYRKELDEKTLKAYRIDLRQFTEYIQTDTPMKAQIEEYITELHKKYKQKTVKRKIASVKAFFSYMEEEEIIEETPFRKIKVKFKETITLPRIIPREDIEKLLNCVHSRCSSASSSCKYHLRDAALLEVLFATGARVYEISNLRAGCVDLSSGTIRIMGKGGKERYIQISDNSIVKLLLKYYEANKESIRRSGFFFVNNRGRRFTEQSIRSMIRKYVKLVGIEMNITPHMFRHSFATYLIEEEVDISCVQQILGHSSIKTTQIYIHVAARKQAEILKKKHPRNKMEINMVA